MAAPLFSSFLKFSVPARRMFGTLAAALSLALLITGGFGSRASLAHAAGGHGGATEAPAATVVAQVAPTAPVRNPARSSVRPLWSELSPAQHEALAPLANQWNTLSDSQKRKWIVMASNYHKMPPPEQARLHGRMDEWVALSPQQRRTARFNFAETKRMERDEKQEKWEAYQALSPDDRQKFTNFAPTPRHGAAAAVKPVPRQKLANVPVSDPDRPDREYRPRIAAPNQIDPHTLLPQRDSSSTLVPRQNKR